MVPELQNVLDVIKTVINNIKEFLEQLVAIVKDALPEKKEG